MIKKMIMFVFILLLIPIMGCDTFRIKTEKEGEPSEFAHQYRTGFSGLELSFAQDMPPDEIYQNSEYKVGVELKNRGAYTIEFVDFDIDVSGYNEKYMELSEEYEGYIELTQDDRIKPELEGRNINNPEGSYDLKTYTGKNIGMPPGLDEYNAVFVVGACYKYETRASIDVCIDPFLYDPLRAGKGNCKVGEVSMTSGQGGPLGVIEVKEQIASSGDQLFVVFTIKIENKGDGKLRKFGEKGMHCIEKGKINPVVTLADKALTCDFDEENMVAVCKLAIGEGPAYIVPLIVKLEYGYFTSTSKTVKVKRIPSLFEDEVKEFCSSEHCKDNTTICYNGYGGIDNTKICDGFCCKESEGNCCNTNDCETITIDEDYKCRFEEDCESGSIIRYYCTEGEKTCCKAK